ncbi:hypothetical protein LTR85_010690 [Meristemomyces frigidus]|nr:hypothetical protein LTR85_010690 [Meristemomyces frigidus]
MLVELYLLVATLEDVGFQNVVVTALVAKLEGPTRAPCMHLPGDEAIGNIYMETEKDDQLRKLVVDAYAKKAKLSDLDKLGVELPRSFLEELTRRSVQAKTGSTISKLDARNYRIPVDSEEGSSGKKRKLN